MKEYTDITVLLDRSGSMASIQKPMEEAFNTLVKGHQAIPTTKLTLVQFDSVNSQEVVLESVPINLVGSLVLSPRGGTPLIDAFVQTIDRLGDKYRRMSESDRPSKVLMIVITDGEENASTRFKRQDVFNRVTKQTNEYGWQFIYLGANQDTFAEATSYGIDFGNTLKFSGNAKNMRSMGQTLTASSVAYASGASASPGNYTVIERMDSATQEDLDKDSIDIHTQINKKVKK